jgi:hypothetical protein
VSHADLAASNPFRRRLRRKDASFKTTVRGANSEGKDNDSGNTDFALNDEYLWLSYDFSVPLAWITNVGNVGPGFMVSWNNPIEGVEEASTFCVRTFFGYNRKRRDELVRRVLEAAQRAHKRPQPAVAAAAATIPRCQSCGITSPHLYDFQWIFSVGHLMLSKPDRRLLCAAHARWRARLLFASNLIAANLGFGFFVSPIINLSNVQEARKADALGRVEAAFWIILGFFPYALLAWLLGWVVWYVIHF